MGKDDERARRVLRFDLDGNVHGSSIVVMVGSVKINESNVAASRGLGAVRWAERGVVGLCLFVGMLSFPELPAATLDPSWRIVLTRAFYLGWQFGHDIVFTYGPLGFLMGNTYDGTHFGVLLAGQALKSALFTVIVLHAGERLPLISRWAGYAAVMFFGSYFDDMLHLSIVLLLGLWVVREDAPPGPWMTLVIGFGLAVLSAIKFTSLLFAAGTVGVATVLLLVVARRNSARMLGAGYVGGFILIWLLARQSLGNLPGYLLNAWRISHGYEATMGVPAPAKAFAFALTVLALFAVTLGVHLVLHRRQPRAVAGILMLAAYGFITWKHGFIRADGHMGGFFTAMLLPATMAPVLLAGEKRFRGAQWIGMALVGLCSVWGLDHAFTVTRSNAWAVYVGKVTSYTDHLVHWKRYRASYDEEVRRLLAESPLERTHRTVGRASIDVLGYDVGLICLHDFNYQPRPVFQSYSAYTPALEQLNLDYFLSARAPEYVLQKLQTIDGRVMTLDDAWLLRLLPQRYEFLFVDDGYFLWHRRTDQAAVPVRAPVSLLVGEHPLGEPLNIERYADKTMWFEVDQSLSWLGRLRGVLYQPPIVRLRLTDISGTSTDYRLPLAQARGGFLINPIVDDAADYLASVSGDARRRIKSLMLVINPHERRFFSGDFHFALSEVPLPPPVKSLDDEVRRARFHMFKSIPVAEKAFIPFIEAELDGRTTIVAHAPSEMIFKLPAHSILVKGNFGFTAGAYSEGGNTDGATFAVLWINGPKREVLFSRHLDPVHAGADRGLQAFSVELGGRRDGRLVLEVNPGPAGSNAWDWTAWTAVEIQTSSEN